MPPVVIENPILNSPFREPTRYYQFDDDGITDQIVEGRRPSSYFVPIAAPRKKTKQLEIDTAWTADKAKDNAEINYIRSRVAVWRKQGYYGVTPTTRTLLDYWQRDERERRLFFCQVEALETLIYLAEAADKVNEGNILEKLRLSLEAANTTLPRRACKMATGSGKTVVMAMIVAWQTLNKVADPRGKKFSNAFLVVAPGITIRDRLRVLLPSDPENYYRTLDLIPVEEFAALGTAKIVVTNFHAFKPKDRGEAGKYTKQLLANGGPNPFVETPDEMARRVCRELGTQSMS